jgi:SAM-dependent methyltransferase
MSSMINYSAKKLDDEFLERSYIRQLLLEVKDEYKICDKRVVELGSGLGFNLSLFQSSNNVTGYEGLDDAVKKANQGGIHTRLINLEQQLPEYDDSVDVVLCLDVLEHLLNPDYCTKEAFRILKPGGLFVINVPNHFALSGRLRVLFGSGIDSYKFFPNSDEWSYPHLRFFRHKSILEMTRLNGFSLLRDYSYRFFQFPLIGKYKSIENSLLARRATHKWPDLFAGGFFLVLAKPVSSSIGGKEGV